MQPDIKCIICFQQSILNAFYCVSSAVIYTAFLYQIAIVISCHVMHIYVFFILLSFPFFLFIIHSYILSCGTLFRQINSCYAFYLPSPRQPPFSLSKLIRQNYCHVCTTENLKSTQFSVLMVLLWWETHGTLQSADTRDSFSKWQINLLHEIYHENVDRVFFL